MNKTTDLYSLVRKKLFLRLEIDELFKKMRRAEIEELLKELSCFFSYYIISLPQMFQLAGARALTHLIKEVGGKTFLDGKFVGDPKTMVEIGKVMADIGVAAFSVHAICSIEALRAAVKNKGKALVFAETVIGSAENNYCDCATNLGSPVTTKIEQLAHVAKASGVDGIMFPAEYSGKFLNHRSNYEGLIRLALEPTIPWSGEKTTKKSKKRTDVVECLLNGASAVSLGQEIFFPPKEIETPLEAARQIYASVEEVFRS